MQRQYLAVPRSARGPSATATQQLLRDFAQAARTSDGVSDVALRRASVVFKANSEALKRLQIQFEPSFIIEPERHLDPLT